MLLSSPKLPGNVPPRESVNNVQDTASESNSELLVGEDPAQTCVDYETRDGSAKNGKDYHSLKGTLVSDAISKFNLLVVFLNVVIREFSYSFVKDFQKYQLPMVILA